MFEEIQMIERELKHLKRLGLKGTPEYYRLEAQYLDLILEHIDV